MRKISDIPTSTYTQIFGMLTGKFATEYSPVAQTTVFLFKDIESAVLDFLRTYGSLPISSLFSMTEAVYQPQEAIRLMVETIYNQYSRQWYNIFKAIMLSDYNPLYNVEGTEKRTIQTIYGKTTTTSGSGTSSTVSEQNTDSTYTHGRVDAEQDYGYNSSTASDTRKSTASGTDRSNSGKTTVAGSASNNGSEALSGIDTTTDILERAGNIGVTKSTELLQDSVDLWSGLSWMKLILRDISNELTLGGWFED